MVTQRCDELEEVIRIMFDGDQSGTYSPIRDPEYILKMMDLASSDDSNRILQAITWLEDDFGKSEVEFIELKPYISIMIAYANCKLNDHQQCLYYAHVTVEQFRQIPNLWNQALAFWFLGIVFQFNMPSEAEKVLKTAIKLLEEIVLDEEKRKYNVSIRDLSYNCIKKIEQIIHEHPSNATSHFQQEKKENKDRKIGFFGKFRQPSTSDISGPAPTPIKKKSLTVKMPQLGTRRNVRTSYQKQESSIPPSSIASPTSFHIIIPVNTKALMNPPAISSSLDENMYDWLREYNLSRSDQAVDKSSDMRDYDTTKQRFIIPPFPIYGRATAGPRGQITFEKPEFSNGVTEDNLIEFYGTIYKVYAAKDNDMQINISGNKDFGWLKIEGESMNLATPKPIENRDYVLFYKINILEACEDKIVIASKPGLDELYPILLIKRLVAMIPTSAKSSIVKKKYYLHSESSREKYKDDIEFTDENQLIGEVIAVAKPIN